MGIREADQPRIRWLPLTLGLTLLLVASASCSRHQQPVALGEGTIELPSVGQELEFAISGGKRIILSTDLGESWYLRIMVDGAGCNLGLKLVGPTQAVSDLGRSRRNGPTPVSLLAERSGIHSLEIFCA